MTSTEAVILALNILLERHKADIAQANQVNIGLNPKFGHGDDIWIRTEKIHVVAEITIAGADSLHAAPKGPTRQEIIKKIGLLRERHAVTHKYFFVSEAFADWARNRHDVGDTEVIAVPGSSPHLTTM
jgi:hypothetical protein